MRTRFTDEYQLEIPVASAGMAFVARADQPPPYEGLDPTALPEIGTTELFGQTTPLVKYTGLPPTSGATGDFEQMSLLAGESVGLVKDVLPAAEITRRIAEEIEIAVRRISGEEASQRDL